MHNYFLLTFLVLVIVYLFIGASYSIQAPDWLVLYPWLTSGDLTELQTIKEFYSFLVHTNLTKDFSYYYENGI